VLKYRPMTIYRPESVADESAVRYPFVVEESSIIQDGVKIGERVFTDVLLRNGERFLVEDPQGFVQPVEFSEVMNDLVNKIGYQGRSRAFGVTKDVLERSLGYDSGDAYYWAQVAVDGDPRFEQLFPHFLHTQIVEALSLPENVYRPEKPSFSRIFTGETNQFSWSQVDNVEMRQLLSQPPIQVSINVPCFSGEAGGYALDPDSVLMRKSQETGEFVFPGGHAKAIYEPTVTRELTEEVSRLDPNFGPGDLRRTVYSYLHRVSMIGIVDQFRYTRHEGIRRYRAYIYQSVFTTIDEYWRSITAQDPTQVTSFGIESLDREGLWPMVPLALLYYSDYLKLSEIAREILAKQKDSLAPKMSV